MLDVMTYSCWDWSWTMLVKESLPKPLLPCRLFSNDPPTERMLSECQLNFWDLHSREIWIKIEKSFIDKTHVKILSTKYRPFCSTFNVLVVVSSNFSLFCFRWTKSINSWAMPRNRLASRLVPCPTRSTFFPDITSKQTRQNNTNERTSNNENNLPTIPPQSLFNDNEICWPGAYLAPRYPQQS